jgi:hypothetical protein
MAMFDTGRYWTIVRMLVVFIVDMLVVVQYLFVRVFMFMALGQM